MGADNKTISFAADTPAGVYTFTVKAEDATGSAEQVFTVIVRADANTLLDTDFSELPAAMTLHEGNGSAEVVNGELQIKTPSGGGAVYARYDFVHAGREATVVAPRKAAPGRPWIWRPAFFGAFGSK